MILYMLEVVCFGLTGVGFLVVCVALAMMSFRLVDQQQKINLLELDVKALKPLPPVKADSEKPEIKLPKGKKQA